jgi:hypothetical protein
MQIETEDRSERKEMLSLGEARSQLEALDFWREDIFAEKANLTLVTADGRPRVGLVRESGTFPIYDRTGLKRQLSISESVISDFADDPDLVRRIFSHSQNKFMGKSVRFTGFRNGVTTVTERKGPWISPLAVFDVVAKRLDGLVEEIKMERRDLCIRFIGKQAKARPRIPGDVSHAGLVVKMNGNVRLGPYCYRLICANGMMRSYERLTGVESTADIDRTLRDLCQVQFTSAQQLLDHMIDLDNRPFEGNREQTLVRLGQQMNLPYRLIEKAIARLPELGEQATLLDGVNILTELASRLRRPDRIWIRLGALTDHLVRDIPRCRECGTELPTE